MRSRHVSVLFVPMQLLMCSSRELFRLYLRNLTWRKYNPVDFSTEMRSSQTLNIELSMAPDTEKCALRMREVHPIVQCV